MKEKIKVALKTEYKSSGFGDKAFDGVASYLSQTVTKEEDIETAVKGVDGLLKAFQGDIDTVRNEKSGLQKELDELKKKSEEKEPKEGEDEVKFPEGTPEEMKALLLSQQKLIKEQGEQLKKMQENFNSMQSGSIAQKRKAQIEEALKDAPAEHRDSVMSGFEFMSFEDDTKFGSYLDGVQTKAREVAAKASTYVPSSGYSKPNEGLDMDRVKEKEEEYKQKFAKK